MDRMQHSVRFSYDVNGLYYSNPVYTNSAAMKSRHSFYDWYLIPEERYSIEAPEQKEDYIDIPGANGSLDFSEALTRYPVYKNIEGSMKFRVLNDRNGVSITGKEYEVFWNKIYNDMKMFLHGRKLYMMLEDNPEWYYYGRFSVDKYDASAGKYSEITVNYNLEPYRKLCWRTDYDCYFDAIELRGDVSGVATKGIQLYENRKQDISINTENYTLVTGFTCGTMPTVPTFTFKPLEGESTVDVWIRYWNENIGIGPYEVNVKTPSDATLVGSDGSFTFIDRQIVFTNMNEPSVLEHLFGNDFALDVKGSGVMSVEYEVGVL